MTEAFRLFILYKTELLEESLLLTLNTACMEIPQIDLPYTVYCRNDVAHRLHELCDCYQRF